MNAYGTREAIELPTQWAVAIAPESWAYFAKEAWAEDELRRLLGPLTFVGRSRVAQWTDFAWIASYGPGPVDYAAVLAHASPPLVVDEWPTSGEPAVDQ